MLLDRRPTDDERRFDDDLARVLRGEWAAHGPRSESTEDLEMARMLSASLAPLRETQPWAQARIWHDAQERIEAQQARPVLRGIAPTAPGRRLLAAAAAVALLVAGLSPVGEQALAAAQDAVQEVVRAAQPGNDWIDVPGGEDVDDPNAITVPYDPDAVEDVEPVP